MIGRSVGKYRILDRIGRGGMGTVYHAIDDTLQREVAIKVLNAEMTEKEALKRFKSEAIALAKLHHPAIATLFELYEEDGDLMMVMEFVHGETLQKLADRMGPMPPDFAAQLCAQALDGLAHAHRAGIVHRDLKPGNIMVTDEGVVKVMDFGIARIAGSEHLTSDGLAMGTPAYMAPEQVLGQEVDARSDLYAMGVVLYRLWTGRTPFEGDTPFAIAHKQIHDAPPALSVVNSNLPAWCDVVLARALAKDPADRFQTAQEFRAALTESAAFMSLGDVATMTLQTPHALPLSTGLRTDTGARSSAVVATARAASADASSRGAWTAERPQTDAVKEPSSGTATASGATLVVSARQLFAGVGAILVVLVVVVIGAVYAIRRGQTPAAPRAGALPALPPPAASSTAPSPRTPDEDAKETATRTQPQPAPPQAPAPPSVVKAGDEAGTPPAKRASSPAPGDVKPAPGDDRVSPATPAAALPSITFGKLKLLVVEGNRAHEEDIDLQFADGKIVVFGAGKQVKASIPYGTVRVSSEARSRQPRWRQPSGAVEQAGIGGGPLGFIKSERTWIAFATQKTAYVFRIDEGRSAQLTATITQRTGVPVVRLK